MSTKSVRLNAGQWLELSSLAAEGWSVSRLARHFRVHTSVVYRGLKKRGITIGSASVNANAENQKRQREELVRKIRETKDNDYKYTEFLQKKVMKIIVDAEAASRPISVVMDDVKTLKVAMEVIRGGTENKWRILGLDKVAGEDGKEPEELPIREMTDMEVEALRDRQAMEDGVWDSVEGEGAEGDEETNLEEEVNDLLEEIEIEDEEAKTAF